jgi:hypothetical protein
MKFSEGNQLWIAECKQHKVATTCRDLKCYSATCSSGFKLGKTWEKDKLDFQEMTICRKDPVSIEPFP